MPKLSKSDKAFLRSVAIKPEPFPPTIAEKQMARAARIARQTPQEMDGVVQLLREMRLPITRANYLYVAWMGEPPDEPLAAEIEEQLPWFLQHSEEE